jgi:hypothetical protein
MILVGDFCTNTKLDPCEYPWLKGAHAIVKLREISSISNVQPMPEAYLHGLLHSIQYGQPEVLGYAYKDCVIELVDLCPTTLQITQTFVQRDKISFFEDIFEKRFHQNGHAYDAADSEGLIVCGLNEEGKRVVGHYIPPIVEIHNERLLLEGMHRCFTSYSRGKTQKVICIHSVKAPFPWSTAPWQAVTVVDQKPPADQRKFGGNPEYFRHFTAVGIDT